MTTARLPEGATRDFDSLDQRSSLEPEQESVPAEEDPELDLVVEEEEAGEIDVVLNMRSIENLRALQPDKGDELVKQLVEMFFELAPKAVEDIKSSLESNDLEQARRAAHSLKSNCATLGLIDLQKRLKYIEEKVRAGEVADLGSEIGFIEKAVPAAAHRLKEVCVEQAA